MSPREPRTSYLVRILAVLTALGAVTLFAAPAAHGDDSSTGGGAAGSELPRPVTIMPLGDSITMGMYGTGADWNANKSLRGGYRARLQELLADAGVQIDFVGGGDGIDVREQLDDKDHEGHGGWQLTGGFGGGLDSIVEAALDLHQPDIVLLHAGTNDLAAGESIDVLADDLSAFLDVITARRPDMYVIVSGLELRDFATDALNSRVMAMVQEKRAAGRKLFFADTSAGWQEPMWGDDENGLHPSLANYEIMGRNWFTAMQTHLPGLFGHDPARPDCDEVTARGDASSAVRSWPQHLGTRTSVSASRDGR